MWHVLQLTTGDEFRCAAALAENGVALFLPLKTIYVRVSRKSNTTRKRQICMVPGYIFFQTPDDWGHVTRLRVNHHLLVDDMGWPLMANEHEMNRFIASASSASLLSAKVHKWAPGDTARLAEGPFAGQTVKLSQIKDGRWRGELVGLFGGGGKTSGDVAGLEAVNAV